MILVPLFKRITAGLMAAVIAASSLVVSSSADQPYEGYNYDWWNDPVPSQNGYVVDQVQFHDYNAICFFSNEEKEPPYNGKILSIDRV